MTNLTVTSGAPLSADKKGKLEQEFAIKYGEIAVKYVVDDAILGGLIIFDGEKVFNGSVAGRLQAFKNALKGRK